MRTHRSATRTFCTLLAAGALAGCARGDSARALPEHVLRDSAFVDVRGERAVVAVAESLRPVWAPGAGWRVSATPRITIGGDEAPRNATFHRVRHAARLPDGRLLVGDGATLRVRLYDPSGRHLRDIGGRAADEISPIAGADAALPAGEFLGLGGFIVHGDTLLVLGGPATIYRYSLQGEGLGRSPVPVEDRFGDGGTSAFELLLSDGSLLAFIESPHAPRPDGPFRPRFGVVRLAAGSLAEDTVGWFGGPEHVRSGAVDRWVAFAANTEIAAGRDRIFVGDSRTGIINVYGYDGRMLRIIRRAWPEVSVDAADAERYRVAFRERVSTSGGTGAVTGYERVLAELPVARALPTFRTILADATGHLWAEAYPWPPGQAPAWSIFDRDGRWLGDVTLPPGLRPLEIGRDYLLGVRDGSPGPDRVELYALDRSR
jgi:hypothetical protein